MTFFLSFGKSFELIWCFSFRYWTCGTKEKSKQVRTFSKEIKTSIGFRLTFFKHCHKAYISEVKIPHKLHSHNAQPAQNRHSYGEKFKAMVKNFAGGGARTRDLAIHDDERQFWQRFSGFFSALVQFLLGTIILNPNLYGQVTIIMAKYEPSN